MRAIVPNLRLNAPRAGIRRLLTSGVSTGNPVKQVFTGFLALALHLGSFAGAPHRTTVPGTPASKPATTPAKVPGIYLDGTVTEIDPQQFGVIDLSTITNGQAPYTIDWSHQPVPVYRDLMRTAYDNTPPGGRLDIDSTALYNKLQTMRSLTKQTELKPSIYYAKVTDAQGLTATAVAVIQRPISWQSPSSNMQITATQTSRRDVNGLTVLPSAGTTIQQTGRTGSFAASDEILFAEDAHYMEMEAPSSELVTGMYAIDPNDPASPGNPKYTIRFDGMMAYLAIDSQELLSVNYNPGDQFAIQTKDGNVTFYQNYALINMTDPGTQVPVDLRAVVSLARPGILSNVKVTSIFTIPDWTAGPLILFNKLVLKGNDVTCANSCGGSIVATAQFILVSSSFSPVSFQLFKVVNGTPTLLNTIPYNGQMTVTFNNLCVGDYIVQFNYNSNGFGNYLSASVNIASMPDWAGITNCTVNTLDRGLAKGFNSVFCDAGAFSENEMSDNPPSAEWFEFGVTSQILLTNTSFVITGAVGLSSVTPSLVLTGSQYINYGIQFSLAVLNMSNPNFNAGGWYNPFYWVGNAGAMYVGDAFNIGDRFKISKTGNSITMYRNNVQMPLINFTSSTTLRADVSLCGKGATLIKPRFSFGCPAPAVYAPLKKQLDGQVYRTQNSKLLFKYDEEYNDTDGKLNFNIYNNQHQVVISSANMATANIPLVSYGDNRYSIDLNNAIYTNGQNIGGGYFILEVLNEKNEAWYLRFRK